MGFSSLDNCWSEVVTVPWTGCQLQPLVIEWFRGKFLLTFYCQQKVNLLLSSSALGGSVTQRRSYVFVYTGCLDWVIALRSNSITHEIKEGHPNWWSIADMQKNKNCCNQSVELGFVHLDTDLNLPALHHSLIANPLYGHNFLWLNCKM